jgi:hypothetical protein
LEGTTSTHRTGYSALRRSKKFILYNPSRKSKENKKSPGRQHLCLRERVFSLSFYIEMLIEVPPAVPKRGLTTLLWIEPNV